MGATRLTKSVSLTSTDRLLCRVIRELEKTNERLLVLVRRSDEQSQLLSSMQQELTVLRGESNLPSLEESVALHNASMGVRRINTEALYPWEGG